MITAVTVTAAVQAASVNWKCTYVYGGNTSDAVSGIAYFLTTDMLAYDAAQKLAGKGASAITEALGSAYSFKGTSGTFTSDSVANATLNLSDGSDYTAYLMIFNTDTVTDTSKYYLTATKGLATLSGADDASKLSFGSQYNASSLASGWSSVGGGSSVPEPTSGLLMLVGLAGLALRRRRA